MFARTLICAALVAATATACGSNTPAAKTPAAAPAVASSTAVAATSSAAVAGHPAATLDAAAVVTRLKAAGLPIGSVTVYTAATDTNHLLGRPGGYTSKASFADTRINPQDAKTTTVGSIDLGGGVEVFPDAAGAKARADYLRKVMAAAPILGTEYDYLSGNVLLRISEVLTPDQAAGYQKALG